MTNKYEIMLYVCPGGTHSTLEYSNRDEWEAAKAFLDARLEASPVVGSNALESTFYYVEEEQRAALDEFFEWTKGRNSDEGR